MLTAPRKSVSGSRWLRQRQQRALYRRGQKSMKRLSAWIAIGCALSLAACQTDANNCAGWKRISMKPDTAVYLTQNDLAAGQGVASHNSYGKSRGCWK